MRNNCLNNAFIFILAISSFGCSKSANKNHNKAAHHTDNESQPLDSLSIQNLANGENNDPVKIDSFFIDEDLIGDTTVVYARLQNTPKMSELANFGWFSKKFNLETDTHLVIDPNYKAIKANSNLPMPFGEMNYDRVLAIDFDQKQERTGVCVLNGDSLFFAIKDLRLITKIDAVYQELVHLAKS